MAAILPGGDSLPQQPKIIMVRRARRFVRSGLGKFFLVGAVLLACVRYYGIDSAPWMEHVLARSKIIAINLRLFQPWPDLPRWDDEAPDSGTWPNLHLLIPYNGEPSVGICRTILSAAILNYPPPTLITITDPLLEGEEGNIARSISKYLDGNDVDNSDLVIIASSDVWFQLPAEVTVNRFFQGIRDSNEHLLAKYGDRSGNRVRQMIVGRKTRPQVFNPPIYAQKVLFGGQKECAPNIVEDPACSIVPKSPLPDDLYGEYTGQKPEFLSPRFLHSPVAMGAVSDIRGLYQAASEELEYSPRGQFDTQPTLAQIFGKQEFERAAILKMHNLEPNSWLTYIPFNYGSPSDSTPALTSSKNSDLNNDFGIGLDYASSIIQVMEKSRYDVHFISFDHTSIIATLSEKSQDKYEPIHLPTDLNIARPPFTQNSALDEDPNIPLVENLDNIPMGMNWSNIKLATNIIVPGSRVPAILSFCGSEQVMDKWWRQMWYREASRALLRQMQRNPLGHVASNLADDGSEHLWNMKGGKGGVWNDRGEWFDWSEICGTHHESVFGDGKGEYGKEFASAHQQPVYNKKGILISGRPNPVQESSEAAQVYEVIEFKIEP